MHRPHWRALFWPAMLPLIIISGLLVNGLFLAQEVYAAPQAPTAQSGHLTFAQYVNEGQQDTAPHGKFVRPPEEKPKKIAHTQSTTLPSVEPPTMQPVTQTVSPTQTDATLLHANSVKPLDVLSSDGRFEVQIPAGAFDLTSAQDSQGATPTGALTLRITQVHGHEMGLLNSLGAYQIQVLDSQNQPLKKLSLRTPLTITYHYQPWEIRALDLNPDQIFLSWPGLLAADRQAKASTANDTVLFTNDSKAHTLTAQTSVLDLHANLSVGSEPNNQSAPTPHFASVQGNSGNLSYSYPLQLAPGTADFTPDLQLVYSSGAPNARHSQVSPAENAGDGWSISLGSITASQQLTPNGAGSETVYSLSGVDHVSDRLIPDPNNAGFFFTEHLSHLRVQLIPNVVGGNQPCFYVWDTSGLYSQYGCTADSLQYYTTAAGRINYRWDLNEERSATQGPTAPSTGIVARYLQDVATVGSYTSIRDAALSQVQYGKVAGDQTTFTAVGTVDFLYHAPFTASTNNGLNQPWSVAYGSNYHCASTPPASTTLRCDDPLTNGSQAAPTTMSTLTLDTIETFVGDDSASNHLDYSYALAYNQDTPFTLCTDPESGAALYCAGEHTLASITPSAYLGGTASAQKPTVFTYSSSPLTNSYIDTANKNLAGQTFSGQSSWKYLTNLDNEQTGVGESITYGMAWNNTHGTPAQNGDDRYEPLFCTLYTTCTGSFANPNDKAWTLQVVTQIQNWGTDSSSTKLAPATTNYDYSLTDMGGSCPSDGSNSDCVGYEWYPSGDGNWLNYYDAEFRGFAAVYITSPAGNLTVDHYATTEGFNTPSTDAENYLTGTLKDEQIYQGNSSSGPLLQETKNTYAGDDNGGSAGSCNTGASGEYPVCENVLLYHKVQKYNGGSNSIWAEQDFYYDDYDLTNGLSVGTGHYHNLTEEDFNYSNAPTTRKLWTYAPTDTTSGYWTYYDVNKPTLTRIYDSSNHIWGCTYTNYDEGVASGVPTPAAGWPTRVQTYNSANCGSESNNLLTRTYTGYDGYGNVVATVDGVGTNNASLYASIGCTPTVQPSIMTPYFGQTRYTSCTNYDGASALATQTINALGQTSTTVYDPTQQDQSTSVTDANNQPATASYSYDTNGNPTQTTKQPLESNSYTDQSTEVSHCTTSSLLPCFEMDTHNSTYSSAVAQTYYDNQGRAVETRTPGPTPGNDTVVITTYNDQNNSVWKSVPFQVTDGMGWLDPNGLKDINGNVPAGTVTFSDALGRAIAVQDPNWNSTQEPGISCSSTLSGTYTSCVNYTIGQLTSTGDTNYYERAISVDPDKHATISYTNALDEVIYHLADSGVYGGTLSIRQLTTTQYNALGKPTSITVTDKQPQSGQSVTSVTTSMTYDDLGRMLTTVDPDQGTFTATYDADNRVTSVVQTSGSNSRTTGTNYDLLGRVGCVQTAAPTFNTTGACTAGNPLLVNTYDTTKLGVQGTTDFPVGRLTQSVATTYYPNSSSATVTQQIQTDQRGRTTNTQMQLGLPSSWNVTASLPSYQLAVSYNDANQVTTTSATAGSASYSFTAVYDGTNGSLQGLGSGSIASTSLASLAYNEYAQLSSITLLNGTSTQVASEQYSFDGDQRPTSLTTNWLPGSGNSGEILGSARGYDNAGNVTSLNTFFAPVQGQVASGGTETQNFCYDEQNRLLWSGNGNWAQGTPQPGAGNGTCGSGTLGSTLANSAYANEFIYTNLGQIWKGNTAGHWAQDQYLYCDSTHPHQLTGIYPAGTTCATKGSATAVYSASYDPWGNETGRTYNSVAATLSYDQSNRLTEWNTGASSQEFYLYDGSGNRVLKRTISGGTTTLTVYAFGVQELTYTGSGAFTSQTDYYSIAGHLIGSTNGTATTYNLTDAEGSVLTSLSSSAVLGEQIYGPYGNQRYTQGTIRTDKGYTGQFQDATTGLDYYNARYYDPVMGQFLSADVKQGNAQGMDPYAYVAGNPETATDPTGQRISCPPDCNTSGGTPTAIHPGESSASSSEPNYMVWNPAASLLRHSIHVSHSTHSPSKGGPSKGYNNYKPSADKVAYDLALQVQHWRRDIGDTALRDYGDGAWYFTDPGGTIISPIEDMGILWGPYASLGRKNYLHHSGDVEQLLMSDFLAFNAADAITQLKSYWLEGTEAQLHIVVWTQYPPCAECDDHYDLAVDILDGYLSSIFNAYPKELTFPGAELVTFDIYGTKYPKWPTVLSPGQINSPADIWDYTQQIIVGLPIVTG